MELVRRALSLWHSFFIFFFFPSSMKGYDTKEKEGGGGHITRDAYELFHSSSVLVSSLNSRSIAIMRAREKRKENFTEIFAGSIASKRNERRKFGRQEGRLSPSLSFSPSKLNRIPEKDGSPWLCTD